MLGVINQEMNKFSGPSFTHHHWQIVFFLSSLCILFLCFFGQVDDGGGIPSLRMVNQSRDKSSSVCEAVSVVVVVVVVVGLLCRDFQTSNLSLSMIHIFHGNIFRRVLGRDNLETGIFFNHNLPIILCFMMLHFIVCNMLTHLDNGNWLSPLSGHSYKIKTQ